MLELVNQLTPENVTVDHFNTKNLIMKKYGYDMLANEADYNLASAMLFNPYYSISDWIKFLRTDMSDYLDFYASHEFASFSIKDKTSYQVSYYNINGDKDYQTNYKLAQDYFDKIDAPISRCLLWKT